MRNDALKLVLIASVLTVYASVGRAHTEPESHPSTLFVSTKLVLLDASVEDRKTGERIADLTADDFIVTEDGETQTVTYVSEDRLPLSIVLMFDVTDTVQPILKPLAAGARGALAHLRPEDEISIMTFATKAKLLQDFTTDHAAMESAMEKASKIHAWGKPTFIHQDLYDAARQAEKATIPNSRRVLIFLTDGTSHSDASAQAHYNARPDGDAPPHSGEEASAEVLRSGAVVDGLIDHSWMTFFVGQGWTKNGKMGEIASFGEMTGGTFLRTGKKEVAEHLGLLIDTIRQRYTLGYKPSIEHPPGTVCHVTVTLSPAFYKRHISLSPEKVMIRARASYVR